MAVASAVAPSLNCLPWCARTKKYRGCVMNLAAFTVCRSMTRPKAFSRTSKSCWKTPVIWYV
jgi:hypothetical protein